MSQAPADTQLSTVTLEGKTDKIGQGEVNKHTNSHSWVKGQTGNPRGTITATGAYQVQINRLGRKSSIEALQVIAADKSRPIMESIAAAQLLCSTQQSFLGLHSRNSTWDYNDGRPVARVVIERVDSSSASDKLAELMRLCGQPDTVKRVESSVVGEGEADNEHD